LLHIYNPAIIISKYYRVYSNKDDIIERELEEIIVKGYVEEELAKLKAEKAYKKRQII
jgi:hypothetical protein